MKKILIAILFVFTLFGCSSTEEYDIGEYVLLIDCKVNKTYTEQVGKVFYTRIVLDKDNKKYDLRINDQFANEVIDMINAGKLLGTEEVLFDVITDGDRVEAISLSKNRK